MTVTYYSYTGEHNRIDKTSQLSSLDSASGIPTGPVDVVTPSVLVEAAVPSGANYAYIDTFDFYYWITEISCDTGTQTVLTMRRDPLMSFKSGIKAAPCICERSYNQYTGELPDSRYRTLQRSVIERLPLYSLDDDDRIIFGFVE